MIIKCRHSSVQFLCNMNTQSIVLDNLPYNHNNLYKMLGISASWAQTWSIGVDYDKCQGHPVGLIANLKHLPIVYFRYIQIFMPWAVFIMTDHYVCTEPPYWCTTETVHTAHVNYIRVERICCQRNVNRSRWNMPDEPYWIGLLHLAREIGYTCLWYHEINIAKEFW